MLCFRRALLVLAIGILHAPASSLRADLVVGYDAADPGMASNLSPINGADVSGGMLSRGVGLSYEPAGGVDYNSSQWTSDPNNPDSTDALLFSFTSSTAYDLTSLQVRGRSTSSGPMTFRLQVDLGQVNAFSDVGSDFFLSPNTDTTLLFDLSSLTGVTSAAFRLLGFNAQNSGSEAQFRILDAGDFIGQADLAVHGAVSVVPEPGAFLFGGLVCGIVGLVAAKRRWAALRTAA